MATDELYDVFQRWSDPRLGQRAQLEDLQSRIWTSLPVVVIDPGYDDTNQTVTVRPTIKGRRLKRDDGGVWRWVDEEMPAMAQVPVEFPTGGGLTLTFPIKVGMEGVVAFQSRAINVWWDQGGVQPVLTPNGIGSLRQHDLSDAIFRPGARSKPNALRNVSQTSTQLRTDDGQSYLDFSATTGLKMVIGGTEVFKVDKDGNLTAKGEVTRGVGTGDSVTLGHHTHDHGPPPDPGT